MDGDGEGAAEGKAVGYSVSPVSVGLFVGAGDGMPALGDPVGTTAGAVGEVGCAVGYTLSPKRVGDFVGASVLPDVVGAAVAPNKVGLLVGNGVSPASVGDLDGTPEGALVGAVLGKLVG